MPALQIHVVNQSWVVTVANTDVQYPFAGATIADQEQYVQQLAVAMTEGPDAVGNGIGEVLQIGDTDAQVVVQQIFNTTDMIMYVNRMIYTAVDETLLDAIEEAGQALVQALLMVEQIPAKPEDSTADISMTFTNYSATEFTRGSWDYELQFGLGSLNSSPGPLLDAHSGEQSMSASQILSTLDAGPYYIWLTWFNPDSGLRFGMQIRVPFQLLYAGTAPHWYVSQDNSGDDSSEPQWTPSGSDPAFPYTWPTSVGFDIAATPNATHTSLDVQVMIQDLST